MSTQIDSSNISNIVSDFGFANPSVKAKRQNLPTHSGTYHAEDKFDPQNKKPKQTPWGKIVSIGVATIGLVGGAIYWIKRGKKPEVIEDSAEKIAREIPVLKGNIEGLGREMKDLSLIRYVDHALEQRENFPGHLYFVPSRIKGHKDFMSELSRDIEEVTEASRRIREFVQTKIFDNPEISEEIALLKRIDTWDGQFIDKEAAKISPLSGILQDLIIAKINPEKADMVDQNFRRILGSSLQDISEKFSQTKGKNNDQTRQIFEKEINTLFKKTQIGLFTQDDLFISKNMLWSINDILDNKQTYQDPIKVFGNTIKRYTFENFLPDNLQQALYKKRNYYEFGNDANIIEANKRGIKKLSQQVEELESFINQQKEAYKGSDMYQQFLQKRQEYIAAKKRIKELKAKQS